MIELQDLAPLAPSAVVDRRVRARCHAALTAGSGQPRVATPPRRNTLDHVLTLGVVTYGVVVLAEGLSLLLR